MRKELTDIAPYGQLWVCRYCGKFSTNRYQVGDVSCFVNSILCYDDETLKIEKGRVISARQVKGGMKNE